MDEHSLDFFLSLQVRDEEGRRRFHGAFSGGYSAGYYNTVGSKEGIVTHSYGLECFIAFCLVANGSCHVKQMCRLDTTDLCVFP